MGWSSIVKFTLVYLAKKSGISAVIISNEFNKIKNYYDSHEADKRRLLS